MDEFDPRIVKIGIEVNGVVKIYQYINNSGFDIKCNGTKYANANQNECEVKISNLDNETLNYILTETSPFNLNKTPKSLTIDAGRQSYGTTRIFKGNIVTAVPSQPPDVVLTMKALTGNFKKGKLTNTSKQGQVKLSKISQSVADDLEMPLNFQASDKNINNYGYTGGTLKQVDKLNDTGQVSAYVDDDVLIVKDLNLPLANIVTVVNLDTGMIGIPEATEQGLKVTFLLDGQTKLGGLLKVTSKIYAALNGNYVIYKLGFNIASRDTPFYWIAEAKRNG